ncbi:MAG TPA: sugar-binding protein, partial [Candidatus Aquilonibacter sp.]
MLLVFACATRLSAQSIPTVAVPATAAPAVDGAIGPSWARAATLALSYDYTYKRPLSEPTTVRITQDGHALYVAFDVTQRATLTANEHTNGSSVLSDDYVGVYLDPQGTSGFSYAFYANPLGTRYQTSSENSAYAPDWTAVAATNASGYAVTMRIPLNVIRSGGSHRWRVQFVRFTVATNAVDVWAYSPVPTSPTDPTFIGVATGIGDAPAGTKGTASRNPARVQFYGLGEATSKVNGGNTSRVGADFSLPVTPTASFVGTVHPDYSNVESDQQTIAPTAFARQYYEVRPFFTQLASFFNQHFSCTNCPATLYTPAIPTFSQGYGIEGTQGRASFAAFDALGDNRTDQAETVNDSYEDSKQAFNWEFQRVAVDAYGLNDDTTSLDGGYLNQHTHVLAYSNNAVESGSLSPDAALSAYHEYGVGYVTATTTALVGGQSIGAEFAPFDGYVAQNDIQGYQTYASHTFNFSPTFWLHDIVVSNYYARFNNHFGRLSQADENPQINLDFHDLLSVHLFTGQVGIRTQDGEFLPFYGNGFYLGYRANTNTPSYVMYNGGPYFHGHLDAWTYLTTLPVTRRIHLTLETDEDKYSTPLVSEAPTNQWLERVALDWQPNKNTQVDLGVRRIVGANLPNSFQPLTY